MGKIKMITACVLIAMLSSNSVLAKPNKLQQRKTELSSYQELNKSVGEDTYELAKRTFTPINSKLNSYSASNMKEITTPGNEVTVPGYDGQVSISDVIYAESGVTNSATKSGPWNTIKYVSLKLFDAIPVVGTISQTCQSIYEGIKTVYSDMNFDQYTYNNTAVWTRYRTRLFRHNLSVYDSGSWLDMGYSESKYYYKCQTMDYPVANSDSYQSRTVEYTKANGYGPTAVRKAYYYMKYSELSDVVYEYWITWNGTRKFYESYY